MKTTIIRILILVGLLVSFSTNISTAATSALVPLSSLDEADISAGWVDYKIAPELSQALQTSHPDDMVSIIVTMKKQADLSTIVSSDRDERVRSVVQLLRDTAHTSQMSIQAYLQTQRSQGLAGTVTRFWIFNGMSLPARASVVEQLAARPDVARITFNETIQSPSLTVSSLPAESNLTTINAPALWELGYFGQGIVVANVDTGVFLYHDDLNAQWRGGTNSWYDPYNEHPDTPTDLDGHGTHTMGIMVGRDAGGSSIGVAPDAQWIAVKIFNDQGQATTASIHAAYQWLLDPDGDPNTADAPHVINNSWGYGSLGCNLEYQIDLQVLRAANILPIFSAGNFGPYSGTSASPANYPEAFAVGATNDLDQIYTYSSRGPSSCGEVETSFPELVAPGVSIRTTERYNLYTDATGTSMAAPHVAGALALLLSAYPQLTVEEQANALLAGAYDLGPVGPDNDFGQGRLDIWSSYQFILAGEPTPTPTPVPDPDANLALNRPVTVSSYKDNDHTGNQAVDGDPLTYWQTAKAVGKNVLPTEWITVDLDSSMPVNEVSLAWDSNYATSYTVQTSNDGSTWTTVFSTITGDGHIDTIIFPSVIARYVKLDSTAWTSDSQRNWLSELAIYARTEIPLPTPTPTPQPTITPTPNPSTTVHIGDLDGSSSASIKNRWDASLSILVHDATHTPIANATVSGLWSDGITGSGSCVTNANGWCDVSQTRLRSSITSVTFAISDVTLSSAIFQPVDNHDPDPDSDGTTILISKP